LPTVLGSFLVQKKEANHSGRHSKNVPFEKQRSLLHPPKNEFLQTRQAGTDAAGAGVEAKDWKRYREKGEKKD